MKRIELKNNIVTTNKKSFYDLKDFVLEDVRFITTGCTLLDCVLGGGWSLNKIVNVVGDKSTGKTLLAIEAIVNFNLAFPDGAIIYDDPEHAFDFSYAEILGLKKERVTFTDSETVEEWYENLKNFLDERKKGEPPGIYILDSMDSLSDRAEKERDIKKGTYGTKAAKVSELFRRLVGDLKNKNVLLFIISQVRDNIGVTFGKKYKRSGGKALDFYCSQVLWLSEVKKLFKVKNKIKRIYGIQIHARCEKNKVGLPFRDCDFPLIFYYGVDDVKATLDYFSEIKMKVDKKTSKKVLDKKLKKVWSEIEKSFLPKNRKY